MADFDGGFKIAARASGPGLSRLAGVAVDGWEPIPDTVQTTERLADRAFRATRGGERFIVYMEAYTRWADSAPWSVLSKSGLLSERERLPCESLVFVLLPRGYRPQEGTFRLAVGGAATQQVWFHEVRLWEVRPEEWWGHHPGLMALYPLCDHGRGAGDAVAFAAEAIRHRALDATRQRDLLATLAIFGRLADETTDTISIIGREHVRDSPVIKEFMLEAEQDTLRAAVLEVIQLRYGQAAADEYGPRLARVTDVGRLRELHRLAIQAKGVRHLRKEISGLLPEG